MRFICHFIKKEKAQDKSKLHSNNNSHHIYIYICVCVCVCVCVLKRRKSFNSSVKSVYGICVLI